MTKKTAFKLAEKLATQVEEYLDTGRNLYSERKYLTDIFNKTIQEHLKIKHNCNICNDTGWFKKTKKQTFANKCDCGKQEGELLGGHGIGCGCFMCNDLRN